MFCGVVFGVCVCGCLFVVLVVFVVFLLCFCVFVVVFLWCLCCWVAVYGLVGGWGVGFGGCVSYTKEDGSGSRTRKRGFLSKSAARAWETRRGSEILSGEWVEVSGGM